MHWAALLVRYFNTLLAGEVLQKGRRAEGSEDTRFGCWNFQRLCSHSFSLENVTDAVRTLGREITDGTEAMHITLTSAACMG